MIFTQSNIRRALFTGIVFLFAIQSASAQTGTPQEQGFKFDGQNYGSGFGAWSDGTRTGDSTDWGTAFTATNEFDIWNNQSGTITDSLPFNSPLAVGETFSLAMTFSHQNSGDSEGFSLLDAKGNVLFTFAMLGAGDSNNSGSITDASGSTHAEGFHYNFLSDTPYSFTLTSATTYTFTQDNGGSYSGTLQDGAAISRIRFFKITASSDDGTDFKFKNLSISAPHVPAITVTTPIAPGVFHLVVNALPDSATPPDSPFVVAPSESVPPPPSDLSAGKLTGDPKDPSNPLVLRSIQGKAFLTLKSVVSSGASITFVFTHDPQDRFYGNGNESENHAGPLIHTSGQQAVRNGLTVVPFIWSPSGYGIFVANDIRNANQHITWSDSNGTLAWTVPEGFADIYLMAATESAGVLGDYARLTGSAPIPPRWTFGFLLSRWGYRDAADVQDKWQQFRDRKIPVDAFIYDYDWFINDWEFNPHTFPDPAANLTQMHSMNLHFVGIRKPRVNGPNADYAKDHGWAIPAPFGTDLRFDIPAARAWWWGYQLPLLNAGVDGWWNDEAEQAYDEFFYMSQQQYLGGRAASPKRQWSIDRVFSPGIQHYGAAAWTGDIDSTWEAFGQQPGTLLNWSMAGMPYVSHDTGGFQSTPSPELYTRWMEEAVFIPVMRAHGTHDSPRWPWAFGDDQLAAMTKAINLRYQLIPYIYTLAETTYRTGLPPMRPLFLEFPDDQATWSLNDEWLLGDRVLAAPVLAKGGERKVYLPAGDWFDGNTGKSVAGAQTLDLTPVPLDVIPFFVRAGTILPLGPVIQSTAEAEDPLEVRIYPGADAAFSLYEDDGDTYDYEKGTFTRIPMRWDDQRRIFTVDEQLGTYPGMPTTRHLVITLPDGSKKEVIYTGSKMTVQL
jgi:alpha-glucosidase